MVNIMKGSYSEYDVREALGGRPVVAAYAKEQDGPKGVYYSFGDSIRHPETGEKLTATMGYCNPNNTYECYYAEYKDSAGQHYYYFDTNYMPAGLGIDKKSISQQQHEDREYLKHKEFFEKKEKPDNNEITEKKHESFFNGTDERNGSQSSSQNTMNNQNTVYNGK